MLLLFFQRLAAEDCFFFFFLAELNAFLRETSFDSRSSVLNSKVPWQ
jgi:hypothetical protein